MRIIDIDLSQDSRCPQKVFGGNAREHNESKLIVKLPDRMIRNDISYYFFEFQTVMGEYIVSPNIYKADLIDKNKITITLWEQLIPAAGDLLFCVNAVNLGKDNSITIKGKTSFCTLQILKSPTGDSTSIDVSSTKEDLQDVIDKALQDAKDSGDFKGDQGDVGVQQMNTAISEALSKERLITNTACANALRGSASGATVKLSDVAPNEHTVGVKVRSKNLFDKDNANIIIGYPDAENVINPAPTTRSVYIPCTPNTTYTVSKTVTARFNVAFADVLPASGVTVTGRIQNNTAASITATSSTDSKYIVVWVYHSGYDTSITLDEILATLQIEFGSVTTAYLPYISDLTSVSVTRSGKNLIPYPYVSPNGTVINGITWTYTSDGTLIADGTATENSNFVIVNVNNAISVAGQKVILSGCPDNGGLNKYGIYYYDTVTSQFDYGEGVAFIPNGVVTITARVYKGETVTNIMFKPQLEFGAIATAYEPYKTPTEYTPTADGTVSGVTSLYPTTTLMTDTEGTIIDAEYNRDINKAFAELQQAIISLGGNV